MVDQMEIKLAVARVASLGSLKVVKLVVKKVEMRVDLMAAKLVYYLAALMAVRMAGE
jgi:hypothetical protein